MRVDELARVPLSFPTYAGILARAAYRAAERLNLDVFGAPSGELSDTKVRATTSY
jgi:dihydrolipoamide dehydrogenase